MRSIRRASLAPLLLLSGLLAAPAAAQYAEIGITGGYSRFTNSRIAEFTQFGGGGTSYDIDNGIRIGVRMSFDLKEFFAHELAYAWQRSGLTQTEFGEGFSESLDLGSMSAHNYYYSLVAHATRQGSVVRPFVSGGGGFTSFVPPGGSALRGGGQTKFGYTYGAGLKFKLSDRYGFRLDVRDHVTSKPFFQDVPGRLHNVETSGTFSWLF
jgi:opacity protein-like surface antigen